MSKLKQIYVHSGQQSKSWSYKDYKSKPGIPIKNPAGEYSVQVIEIYTGDIYVKILTAPEPVLADVNIRISQRDFTKCLEKNLFHKVQDMLVIKGTFQIYAGFLKLMDE